MTNVTELFVTLEYLKLNPTDECVLWEHSVDKDGYGVVRCAKIHRWNLRVHRVALGLGPDTSGLVLHSCENKGCYNPRHLRIGTAKDNKDDQLREGTSMIHKGPRGASGFKGVHYYKRHGNWSAHIKLNGSKKHLGYFNSPEEAARCYDRAAFEAWGKIAFQNFG